MAKQRQNEGVDLSESSVYGHEENNEAPAAGNDIATESLLDRLEDITGGAGEDPGLYEGELGQRVDELDASTEEEVDALKVNLLQDDALPDLRDGSGRVVDDVAEERIAEYTEVGPMQPNMGGQALEPGRDDTSAELRSHHPNTEVARSEDIVEGNIEDEPRDEMVQDRKADGGPGA
jgi:hypothetical protein